MRAHGIYVRNKDQNLPTTVANNVFFDNFGYGIHASSDVNVAGEDMYAVVIKRNISFNNGSISMQSGWKANILLGVGAAGLRAARDTVRANVTYFSPGVATSATGITLGREGFTNEDVVVDSNYIVEGSYFDSCPGPPLPCPDYRGALNLWAWTTALVKANRIWSNTSWVASVHNTGLNWISNAYYRPATASAWIYQTPRTFSDWQTQTGMGGTDLFPAVPTTDTVIARAASLDWLGSAALKRGTIAVVNWSHTAHNASVDLSNLVAVGDSFWIRNVQQLGTIVSQNVYQGGTVSLPVGQVIPPTPVGSAFQTPPTTHDGNAVWFDGFVVDSRTPLAPPPQLNPPTNCQLQKQPPTGTPLYLKVTWTNSGQSGVSTEVWISRNGNWTLQSTEPPGSGTYFYTLGSPPQTGLFTARVRHVKTGFPPSNFCNTGSVTI
jgi:hypothetical protein